MKRRVRVSIQRLARLGVASLLLASGARADDRPEAPTDVDARAAKLRLVWVDVRGAGGPIRARAMAETALILGATGLDVEWYSSDGASRPLREDEIQVVLLPSPPAALWPDVMGSARRTAQGARSVWVFVSGVRATLGYDPQGRGGLRSAELESLSRAVGRVIVHEIVHATAPDRAHSKDGLMAPRLGRATLLEPNLGLEAGLRTVLHRAVSDSR
jgi:hypothetical protein